MSWIDRNQSWVVPLILGSFVALTVWSFDIRMKAYAADKQARDNAAVIEEIRRAESQERLAIGELNANTRSMQRQLEQIYRVLMNARPRGGGSGGTFDSYSNTPEIRRGN